MMTNKLLCLPRLCKTGEFKTPERKPEPLAVPFVFIDWPYFLVLGLLRA
jgi:hypothetical protein